MQLRLPWQPWGEVDQLLTQALTVHEEKLCPCGCGRWATEAHDPANEGRYVVETATCYAREAISQWQRDNPKAGPGAIVGVRLLPGGVTAEADLLAELDAMKRRHGLT